MKLTVCNFGHVEWLSYNREHVSLLPVTPFSIKLQLLLCKFSIVVDG